MQFRVGLHQLELDPKLIMQGLTVIVDHVQAGTLLRTIRAEGGYNHVSAGFDGTQGLSDIGLSFLFCRQKVKDSSVMPDVKSRGWKLHRCDIGPQPID